MLRRKTVLIRTLSRLVAVAMVIACTASLLLHFNTVQAAGNSQPNQPAEQVEQTPENNPGTPAPPTGPEDTGDGDGDTTGDEDTPGDADADTPAAEVDEAGDEGNEANEAAGPPDAIVKDAIEADEDAVPETMADTGDELPIAVTVLRLVPRNDTQMQVEFAFDATAPAGARLMIVYRERNDAAELKHMFLNVANRNTYVYNIPTASGITPLNFLAGDTFDFCAVLLDGSLVPPGYAPDQAGLEAGLAAGEFIFGDPLGAHSRIVMQQPEALRTVERKVTITKVYATTPAVTDYYAVQTGNTVRIEVKTNERDFAVDPNATTLQGLDPATWALTGITGPDARGNTTYTFEAAVLAQAVDPDLKDEWAFSITPEVAGAPAEPFNQDSDYYNSTAPDKKVVYWRQLGPDDYTLEVENQNGLDVVQFGDRINFYFSPGCAGKAISLVLGAHNSPIMRIPQNATDDTPGSFYVQISNDELYPPDKPITATLTVEDKFGNIVTLTLDDTAPLFRMQNITVNGVTIDTDGVVKRQNNALQVNLSVTGSRNNVKSLLVIYETAALDPTTNMPVDGALRTDKQSITLQRWQNTYDYTFVQMPPIELPCLTPENFLAGDVRDFYVALVDESVSNCDIEYTGDGALTALEPVPGEDDRYEVVLRRAGTGNRYKATLQKFELTREVQRTVDIEKVLPAGSGSFLTTHDVKAGDNLALTVTSNERGFTMVGPLAAVTGMDITAELPGPPNTHGVTTYTAAATVAGIDPSTVSPPVDHFPWEFEINPAVIRDAAHPGDAPDPITHESDYYNTAQDKIEYWLPVPTAQTPLQVQVEGGYDLVLDGDTLQFHHLLTRDFEVTGMQMGSRTISPPVGSLPPAWEVVPPAGASGTEKYVEVTLDGTEGYTSGSVIGTEIDVQDPAGNVAKLVLNPEDSLLFYVPASTPKADVLVLGSEAGVSGPVSQFEGAYFIQKEEELHFTFLTNERGHYKALLEHADGTQSEREYGWGTDAAGAPLGPQVEIVGGETYFKYTCSFAVNDILDENPTAEDNDILDYSMEVQAAGGSYSTAAFEGVYDETTGATGFESTLFTYIDVFEMLSLHGSIRYPAASAGYTPDDADFYVVQGDVLRVKMVFNHSLLANSADPAKKINLSIAGIAAEQRTKTELEGWSAYNFQYRHAYFYVDRTNATDDTIYLFIRLSRESDEANRILGLQDLEQDEVPILIDIETSRAAIPEKPRVALQTEDYPPQQDDFGNELYHQLLYLKSGFDVNAKVTLKDTPDEDTLFDTLDGEEHRLVVVRNNDTISLYFTAGHLVRTAAAADGSTPVVIKLLNDNTEYNHFVFRYQAALSTAGSYVYRTDIAIGDAPLNLLEDLQLIKFSVEVQDLRGQTARYTARHKDGYQGAIYYAPLEITKIEQVSSNSKDELRYCKDEDTITVSFVANHAVQTTASIIGRNIGMDNTLSRRADIPYRFSYTLANGDMEDLSEVVFAFSVVDLPGDTFSYDTDSVGNRLQYYAPLEAVTSITSNNAKPLYAKNGDTITLSNKVNHEACILDLRIGARGAGEARAYVEAPTIAYTIPAGEQELTEGDVYFSFNLEDPAGNLLPVSETNDNGDDSSRVIYDRTAPAITIIPGFSGFTNQDVHFSVLYSDMYLDMPTLSCVLNERQRLGLAEGTQTSYTYEVVVSEDGSYMMSATAVDMAGNETEFAAVCHVIVDKVNPEIRMELTPNTYRTGFLLEQITTIEEEFVREVVCTVSDNTGVYDWTLEQPIETEGKKTVFVLARDMAGNNSVPITYDIYIDGTAPQPILRNTQTSKAMVAGEQNYFYGIQNQMELELAPIHIGDEVPDHFTTLQIVDEAGAVVHDFLAGEQADTYTYRLPEYGSYTLLVNAADAVGNETGLQVYAITYRQKYLLETWLENTRFANLSWVPKVTDPMLFGAMGGVALLIALLVVLLVRRRKKKRAQAAA